MEDWDFIPLLPLHLHPVQVYQGQLRLLVPVQGHPAEWMSALCLLSSALTVSCVPAPPAPPGE